MHSTRGTTCILSMLDSSTTNFLSIYWICSSNTLCSASSARQQEIFGGRNFAGTNFRELAFDRENRENFYLAKISRYTVNHLTSNENVGSMGCTELLFILAIYVAQTHLFMRCKPIERDTCRLYVIGCYKDLYFS